MVGVQILVEGRPGLLLADLGYHVPRVVTVMVDQAYPHTGWFTQSDEPHCRKEYNYTFNVQNGSYVEWHERDTRQNTVKCKISLVYAARPYLDAINVTERRNLVYNFRSLLARDQQGHLIAGLYFAVTVPDPHFTIFYDNGSEKRKTRCKVSIFSEPENIPITLKDELERCNAIMKYKEGELRCIVSKLALVMSDHNFVTQLLKINEQICNMSP